MSNAPTQAGLESQICRECGFCCDGTLFDKADSADGDTIESFIQLGLTPITDSPDGKAGFRQPCPNFAVSCSVYESRPAVCRGFRCRLLRSAEAGKHNVSQALSIVREARAMREALLPGFDTLCADAPDIDGATQTGQALISRLGAVVRRLHLPETAQFRAQYGRPLRIAVRLVACLTNDFLPVAKAGNSARAQRH